jgi:hypothetical protein
MYGGLECPSGRVRAQALGEDLILEEVLIRVPAGVVIVATLNLVLVIYRPTEVPR